MFRLTNSRRAVAAAGVAMASAAMSVLMIAPSASASSSASTSASTSSAVAAAACYRQNNWSFKNIYSGRTNQIDAWSNTTCSGSSVLRGRVSYNASTRNVTLNAYDFKADNYGVTLYTHGPSVTASGNGDSVTGGGDLSSFQTPYNFWIRVGGQQNSVSMPFPI